MTKAELLSKNIVSNTEIHFLEDCLGTKDFEVYQLAGDASNRQYFRVVQGETSMVLMKWEPFTDNNDYPFLSVLDHFGKHNVHVPKVLHKSPPKGLILLEDLGDLTLERKFWEIQNKDLVLPFYKQSIDELIKIHYPASNDLNTHCTAFKVAFNNEKLLWEMNYGNEHLFEKMFKISLNDSSKKELGEIFNHICTVLDVKDKVICHRDYHSRNLMIKLGQVRVIDFQDARMGPIQYDLISLIHDSYVNIQPDLEKQILDYYFEQAAQYQPGIKANDEFYELYKRQLIQRCFKACGSFSSFYNMREDKRYLKYLKGTLNKVVSQLEVFSEYKLLKNIIVDNGLLEKDYSNPPSFEGC